MKILFFILAASAVLTAQIPVVITTHSDTIPVYGATPTIVATQDGEWQAASTWDQARVPISSDAVHVPAGRYVHGTAAMQALDIVIEGNLTLDNGFDLPVRTITVLPSGDLKLLGAGNLAIRDMPIDTGFDPLKFGHGLLVIDGAITIEGVSPRQTWATLAEEIKAGDTAITLASAPANWQAGDVLILPDTRQPSEPGDLAAASSHVERVTIQSISGAVVTLTAPVAHGHLGWRNQQGEVEILPDVGNLTQAVTIGSANPLGTPGHVFLTQHANVEIDGLSLIQMGRTTTAPLGPANQIGRYALHLHHLLGRPNNGKPHQFRVNRVAIDGGPKWGIAVHGSHYGVVTNNFIFDQAGAGIVTEDPLEYGNDISGNMMVFYREGSGQRITERAHRNLFGGDHWHDRVGLGLQSAMNRIVGNHIYGAKEGIGMAGFRTTTLWWPTLRGVHTPTKSSPGALIWFKDPYRYPFVFETSGNQIWGGWRGIETWTADSYPEQEQMFPGLTIIHTRHPTDFEDQRETTTYGWKFRGDFSRVTSPVGSGDGNTFAIAFKPAYEFGHTHFDADIRGYDVGYRMIDPSDYSKFVKGRFEVAAAVYQPLGRKFSTNTAGWTGLWEDIIFVPVASVPFKFIDGWYPKYDIGAWLKLNNLTRKFLPPNSYQIRPWIDGRDIDVFHHFQSAGFEMPPIAAPNFYGDFPPGIYKNADLIALGTPIFGAAIPSWAEQLAEFPGFYVATPGGPSPYPCLNLEQCMQSLQQCVGNLP